jgi:proteasome lid subunit RPN8/RPN11
VSRPTWVAGNLTVSGRLLEEVEAHAREAYPSECCGFLLGPADAPGRLDGVQREVNEADKYHRLDPERFPRTSRTYFKMNELRAARTFDAQASAGRPVKVIYHSHCDAGAYFSDEDAATFSSRGELQWPCAFLVVSVMEGQVRDRRLWVHREGTDAFDESTLTVEP